MAKSKYPYFSCSDNVRSTVRVAASWTKKPSRSTRARIVVNRNTRPQRCIELCHVSLYGVDHISFAYFADILNDK